MVSLRLPLILLSLLAISFSCSAAPPPVYDTEGHELSADGSYYVLPASPGHGGGLTMAPRVLPCPLLVAQETDERRKGFPVRFTPWGGAAAPEDRTIRVSTDVRIRFNARDDLRAVHPIAISPRTGSRGPRPLLPGPLTGPTPTGRKNRSPLKNTALGKNWGPAGNCAKTWAFQGTARGRGWARASRLTSWSSRRPGQAHQSKRGEGKGGGSLMRCVVRWCLCSVYR
ncbi:hypothetical protein OsJ_15531 [Oryza sativa Japonica Group]|uniref:Uncharacterized protein n=1 Tax=Oryza sativa subsp. japonica TaxID=39947 RepID=A3AVR1_ORYSJ|nr:hypothetical protein OsJ_15531 [Oryza sativa Japonica Group]